MTTPFGPFLDPPVAIVKENFVILNAMHQKNEFGGIAGTVWSFAFHAPSRFPICVNCVWGSAELANIAICRASGWRTTDTGLATILGLTSAWLRICETPLTLWPTHGSVPAPPLP